jgi:hypothetical protein
VHWDSHCWQPPSGLERDRLRYDPVADRAYLLATRVPPHGAAEPTMVGVAFALPAMVFADGFE